MEYSIVFYEDAHGEKPLSDFLSRLKASNTILHKSVLSGLERLRFRENHRMPLTRAIVGSVGVLEMRVGHKDIARVFFFFHPGGQIVCTNGYVKKSQRLDTGELKFAERCKLDWERRFPETGVDRDKHSSTR